MSLDSVARTSTFFATLKAIKEHSRRNPGSLFTSKLLNSENCGVLPTENSVYGEYYSCERASTYAVVERSKANSREWTANHFERREDPVVMVEASSLFGGYNKSGTGTTEEEKLAIVCLPASNFLEMDAYRSADWVYTSMEKIANGLSVAFFNKQNEVFWKGVTADHWVKSYIDGNPFHGTQTSFANDGTPASTDWNLHLGLSDTATIDEVNLMPFKILNQLEEIKSKGTISYSGIDPNVYVPVPPEVYVKLSIFLTKNVQGDVRGMSNTSGGPVSSFTDCFTYMGYTFVNCRGMQRIKVDSSSSFNAWECFMMTSDSVRVIYNPVGVKRLVSPGPGGYGTPEMISAALNSGRLTQNDMRAMETTNRLDAFIYGDIKSKQNSPIFTENLWGSQIFQYMISTIPTNAGPVTLSPSVTAKADDVVIKAKVKMGVMRVRPHHINRFVFRDTMLTPATPFGMTVESPEMRSSRKSVGM